MKYCKMQNARTVKLAFSAASRENVGGDGEYVNEPDSGVVA